MSYVIKNVSGVSLVIDGVTIEADRQLSIQHLTPDMKAAEEAGTLQVRSDKETLEERRVNIAAFKISDKT